MRKLAAGLAGLLLLAGMTLAAPADQTYTGAIMDSGCAAMAAHQGMGMEQGNFKADKQCTLDCVKAGAKFVLYDPVTKTVYQLDDQKKPERYAGENVKITGTYDATMTTIHVKSITGTTKGA
jgi:hypothetical protein